jgi:hypothetical protein
MSWKTFVTPVLHQAAQPPILFTALILPVAEASRIFSKTPLLQHQMAQAVHFDRKVRLEDS